MAQRLKKEEPPPPVATQRDMIPGAEAARLLGITERHLRSLREAGHIEGFRLGRKVNYDRVAVLAYLEASKIPVAS